MAAIGTAVMIAGGAFRVWSQRTLGQLFTWEVSIRPSHVLVTGGPYSIVRHPAYAGGILIVLGQLLFGFSGNTFFRECVAHAYPTPFLIINTLMWLYIAAGITTTVKRASKEDAMLKKEFGSQWDEWAKKTPYKFVPGII